MASTLTSLVMPYPCPLYTKPWLSSPASYSKAESARETEKGDNYLFIYFLIYLIGVLRRSREYFTADSNMV